jgi:hypothetical protein
MPKAPSALGKIVEVTLERHFVRYRDPVQYLATFKASSGAVFAAERVTLNQIMLWLPNQECVRQAAASAGIICERSVAWPAGRSGAYGRIHTLKSISALCDAPLLKVPVTTAGDALRIAESIA